MKKSQAGNTKHQHKRQQGFTLLELLVVISLLGIISTIAIVSYENVQDESMVDVTKFEMQELKKALLRFRVDNRAFPCGVYTDNNPLVQARPYDLDEVYMQYAALPASPANGLQKKAWCEGVTNAENNALQMLMKFPYDVSDLAVYTGDVATLHPLWNADIKRGWRGPYLSSVEGIKDTWGKYYRLIDPELDFAAYDRDNLWCGLDITDPSNPFYNCSDTNTVGDKPGNSARIVSMGPNGLYGGPNTTNPTAGNPDPCLPNVNDDDLVLCLLK